MDGEPTADGAATDESISEYLQRRPSDFEQPFIDSLLTRIDTDRAKLAAFRQATTERAEYVRTLHDQKEALRLQQDADRATIAQLHEKIERTQKLLIGDLANEAQALGLYEDVPPSPEAE